MVKQTRNKQRKNIRVVVKQSTNKPKKKKNVTKSEVTLLGKALRSLGGAAGGVAGGFLGQPALGRSVGSNLGASLSKWIGSGDYTVKANTLTRASAVDSIPMMHRNSQSVIVRHREFLGDVVSSTGFTIQRTIKINPGLESSFPWLATIAQNFQEYTILGLVFHYVPTAGDAVASTNNALGSVVMSTNYRATASPPTTKLEQLNEYFSNDARPCEAFCHPIECDPRENPYNVQYVRSVAVPMGEDPKTYDLGTVYVATAGMQQSGVTVGELWCTYEVELRKPVAVGLTGNALASTFATTAVDQPSGTQLAAGLTTGLINDTIGVTLSGSTSIFTVQFPAGTVGTYLISLYGQSNGGATTWNAPSLVNAVVAHTSATQIANAAASGASFVYTCAVTITNPSVVSSVLMSQTSWNHIAPAFLNITQSVP